MSNGYLTSCALVIAVLITMMFFIKKGVKNIETKIFKRMLFCNIFESLSTTLIVVVALTIDSNFVFKLLNRIDVMWIIIWCSLMFYYIYTISGFPKKEETKKFVYVIDSIIFVLALVLNVEIINENGILDSTGPLTYLGFAGATFYILLMVILLIKSKNNDKLDRSKYIPLYFLILLLIIVAILRLVIPQVNFVSILLSLVDMIMIFTIENPDVKLINELSLAKNQAERSNRAKSDFLSSMSHEIRTPLNAIVGLSEVIVSNKEQVPKEIIEDIEDIQTASQTLLEIVGNILDINKIESEKMELVESPYNFKEEITKMARITSTRIGDKPIDFKINISDAVPYELIGDVVHVKEIVNNLLTNAIKYTEKGEIILKVDCVNNNQKSVLTISVQDTGRGIKEENLDKLFTKFQRLEEDKNTTIEGTGLGLAITKALVGMMGGKINVQSQFGQGSIFTIIIPQMIHTLNAPQTNPTANNLVDNTIKVVSNENNTVSVIEPKDENKKRVLIVDDSPLNIKVAKKNVENLGYIVDSCESGFKCIDKIKMGEQYDLILMDIMMPEMSGETTLEKLKEDSDFNIPVIALTADAISGAKEKYLAEGFNDYIPKPFTKEEIKEKIDLLLKQK